MALNKGVCIGGAAAGKIVESRSESYTHRIPLELLPLDSYMNRSPEAAMTEVFKDREEYLFHKSYTTDAVNGDVCHGFWVPFEMRFYSHHYVLTELTKAYVEALDPFSEIKIKTVEDWVRLATRTLTQLPDYMVENGRPWDAAKANQLLQAKAYRDLHMMFERAWTMLPDRASIRFGAFFPLCDLCSEAWVLTEKQ